MFLGQMLYAAGMNAGEADQTAFREASGAPVR